MSRTMRTRAAGLGAGAVAGQGEEIHRPVGAGAAQRADQVGGEHEAALQHRDHQRVGRQLGGQLDRHVIDAGGDLGGGEADRDGGTVGHGARYSTIGTMSVVPVGRIVERLAEASAAARRDRALDQGIGAFAQHVVVLREDQLQQRRRACRLPVFTSSPRTT